MSKGQANRSNRVSFSAWTPGLSQSPGRGADNLKGAHCSGGSEFSSCSSPSEQSDSSSSLKFPVRKICMGRPYSSKFAEISHLADCPNVARKPSCRGSPYCLLCTDAPLDRSSPTFLDQLIKGINYLDRSAGAFYHNCPRSLSLPKLAANYLEQAANSICPDRPDHPRPRGVSDPSPSMAASYNTSACMVPSPGAVGALRCVDDSVNASCSRRLHSQNFAPRSGIRLPELPLFGNGIFSLGHLPTFWEAIRSGWRSPKPVSKPCSWW